MTRPSGSRQSKPRSAADTDDGGAISAQVVVLRAVHSFKTAEVAAALETARRAITLDLGEAPRPDRAPTASMDPRCTFRAASTRRKPPSGGPCSWPRRWAIVARRIYALGYLALISAEHGQLADAEHQIRRASGSSPGPGGCGTLRRRDGVACRGRTPRRARRQRLQRRPPPTWPSCRPAKVERILEVAKTLLVRAKIFEHLGDHQTAKAILEEVEHPGARLRGRWHRLDAARLGRAERVRRGNFAQRGVRGR